MKKLELYLNIMHYCFYKFEYKLHLYSNKINPFNSIHRLPFQKRKYEELGIDIHSEINKVFGSKEFGLSTLIAGGGMIVILVFLILTLINVWNKFVLNGELLTIEDIIVSSFLSVIYLYFAVFKKDKYLKYFDEFEKWDRKKIRKHILISMIIAILVPVLFILSIVI